MNSAGPTAIHERHRASGRRPLTATIACPNCGIYQPVEVDYDGDQGYAALPVTPCSVCHQDLCCFCDQASCECGLTVCLNCIVTVQTLRSTDRSPLPRMRGIRAHDA